MSIDVPDYLGALFLTWSGFHFIALGAPQKRSILSAFVRVAVTLAIFSAFSATLSQWCMVAAWVILTLALEYLLIDYEDIDHTGSLYALNVLAFICLHILIVILGETPTPNLSFPMPRVGSVLCTLALLLLASRTGNHLVRSVVNSSMRPQSVHTSGQAEKSGWLPNFSVQKELASTLEDRAMPLLVVAASEDQRLGRVIGTLERLLIITLVTTNSYEALAFVIGAKGFVRYSKFSEEAFAEYFLIGTLSSTLIGVALGLSIRALW